MFLRPNFFLSSKFSNMSSDWKHLELEFKNFRLEEKPINEEPVKKSCSCPDISKSIKTSSLLDMSSSKLKVKDKRGNQLIRPARLKVIGNCYAKKLRGVIESKAETKEIDDFTSEAFLKMRISTSVTRNTISIDSPSASTQTSEERLPSTSSSSTSLNCSTQAKMQRQLSTTEFEDDSTIDEMSDFLAYHLSLFNHRDNLIDSMYT